MENEKSFWRKTLDIALNMINILKKSNAFKAYWKFTITKNRKANEIGLCTIHILASSQERWA